MSASGASILITGGTGGLGAAVVSTFLDRGWRVVVPWLHRRETKRLTAHSRLDLVEADLFDVDSVRAVAQRSAGDETRPLRAVANLVGGFASGANVAQTPVEEFEDQFRLNLRATYLVCQATVQHLSDSGGGAITCVSSRAALRPFAGAAGYISSKLALLGLVDALATEYLANGVRVNALLPSVIDTPGNRADKPGADHTRWVRPDQIADVIHFLSGEAATAISGAHIPVYGRA